MLHLDISDAKMAKMDEFETSCLDVVIGVVKNGDEVGEKAKVAIKGLGIVAKNRQTQSNRMAVQAHLAEAIAKDQKEFRKYVMASQPEIKRLTA